MWTTCPEKVGNWVQKLKQRRCLLKQRRCLLKQRQCLLKQRRCLLKQRQCLYKRRRCFNFRGSISHFSRQHVCIFSPAGTYFRVSRHFQSMLRTALPSLSRGRGVAAQELGQVLKTCNSRNLRRCEGYGCQGKRVRLFWWANRLV